MRWLKLTEVGSLDVEEVRSDQDISAPASPAPASCPTFIHMTIIALLVDINHQHFLVAADDDQDDCRDQEESDDDDQWCWNKADSNDRDNTEDQMIKQTDSAFSVQPATF